jgi:hypothetical protein
VTTGKLGFPLGITSTNAAATVLSAPIECVRAPCPGLGPQVLASLPIVVKRRSDAYVEATGSLTATEPGKEATVGISLAAQTARPEPAPQITVTAVSGHGTPFTVANIVPLIGSSEVGGLKFTNVVTLRASEISGGARLMVGKVNVVAIVLPAL